MFSSAYTLSDHNQHLEAIINDMSRSEVKSTNPDDEKNANNQLVFLKKMNEQITKMLTLYSIQVAETRAVGKIMNDLPFQYFGPDGIPSIEGDKSKAFALLLANHFRDFTKVKFPGWQVQASKIAAPIVGIKSIPDQIEHYKQVAKDIENRVEKYNQPSRLAPL